LQKKFSCYETQQLILRTGTAIWWVTEPHWNYAKCATPLWLHFLLTLGCKRKTWPKVTDSYKQQYSSLQMTVAKKFYSTNCRSIS